MTDEITYEAGRLACRAWNSSPQFAQFSRSAPVRDIMRLFLSPVPGDMMQIQRPLPKHYQDWMHGFRDESAEMATYDGEAA